MFFLSLPIAEKILRPIIVYLFLIVGLRLALPAILTRQIRSSEAADG